MTSKSPCATETGRKIVEHHDTLAGIEERVNHVASDYPAPPVTRTVMLGARSYCEIVAFAHRNMAQNNRFECPLLTPQNKRWDLRQHRQQRLHKQCLFSDPSKVGSGPSAGSTDDTDGTDGAFSTCAHLDHSRPRAAFTGCQSRRDTRRHTYRFFPVALAVLPRTTFAAAVGFDALAGSAERVAAALVRRTPG
jgi:hypothetical protein